MTAPDKREGIGLWHEVPNREVTYDYTYDEDSLERLGSIALTS